MRALVIGVLTAALLTGSANACRAPAAQSNNPALGSGIEEALKEVTLSRRDTRRLDRLRRQMARLAAAQQIDKARAVEDKAMRLLGYEKRYSWCRSGGFVWGKANF